MPKGDGDEACGGIRLVLHCGRHGDCAGPSEHVCRGVVYIVVFIDRI